MTFPFLHQQAQLPPYFPKTGHDVLKLVGHENGMSKDRTRTILALSRWLIRKASNVMVLVGVRTVTTTTTQLSHATLPTGLNSRGGVAGGC